MKIKWGKVGVFAENTLNIGENILKSLSDFYFLSLLNKSNVSRNLLFEEICKDIGFFNIKKTGTVVHLGSPLLIICNCLSAIKKKFPGISWGNFLAMDYLCPLLYFAPYYIR
ncbi:hypothetical protein M2459_002689 [Parabacteroides sp. PF5-5]|uniref:hypothetical protein n=1 Tax=unclassified Parabacteroides TaxID=2649774 RepID=UPI0024740376|nr:MULTISPECIES: hypothetical protein [unclassified Parabacteroides]MDH6306326.1 hypothetical protein [Parabacteroides sp. PH5-39]MDH6316883.1 hypothetical protein [Parabacteroides sp. PF5-13]MDH6320952.1 hypothetical protein [Parabacteroides sp. PH5-13]MDH6324684.1 hypothetical protein [Parabacteroides sp. PH5-8]MDH6328068.1 hypothetical protein [Parabacteroides sp. PH5-41]